MVLSKRLRNSPVFSVSDSVVSISSFFNSLSEYRKNGKADFDESIDVCFRLGCDPKKSDQVVKTSCVLPNGSGKKVSVAVFSSSSDVESLNDVGATFVGGEDLIDRIYNKELIPGRDFSICISAVDIMPKLTKIARILGPKGLMPNAKLGTVSDDLHSSVSDAVNGRAELRTDKFGYVRLSIARLSFDNDKIMSNLMAVYEALKTAKPSSIKGSYFLGLFLSTTMMGRSFAIKMSDVYNA